MKFQLASAVPCKRFDYLPLCEDGRGGWTFSQFSIDRYVSRPDQFGIKLGIGVIGIPAEKNTFIEFTELKVEQEGSFVAINRLTWKKQNRGGVHHEDASIFEWIQDVEFSLLKSGLLKIEVSVKTTSSNVIEKVDGCAFLYVSIKGGFDNKCASNVQHPVNNDK